MRAGKGACPRKTLGSCYQAWLAREDCCSQNLANVLLATFVQSSIWETGSYGGEYVPGASTLMEVRAISQGKNQIKLIRCSYSILTGDSLIYSLASRRTTAQGSDPLPSTRNRVSGSPALFILPPSPPLRETPPARFKEKFSGLP